MCSCVSHLRYDPQSPPQAVKADVSDVLSPDVNVPLLRLVEAEQQPHNGALPVTGVEPTVNIISTRAVY